MGLGWALNAGGSITRTIRGLADESPNGWLNTTFRPSTLDEEIDNYALFEDISDGLKDSEPDIFYYNLGSGSGKFLYNDNNEIVTIPKSGVKIEPSILNNKFEGFIITDITGDKYYFGESSDASRTAYQTMQQSLTTCTQGGSFDIPTPSSNVVNGWYLLQIQDANFTEEINFYYEIENITSCALASQSQYSPPTSSICDTQPSKTLFFLLASWLIPGLLPSTR